MSLLLLFQAVAASLPGGGGFRGFWRRLNRLFVPAEQVQGHQVVSHRVGPHLVE